MIFRLLARIYLNIIELFVRILKIPQNLVEIMFDILILLVFILIIILLSEILKSDDNN